MNFRSGLNWHSSILLTSLIGLICLAYVVVVVVVGWYSVVVIWNETKNELDTSEVVDRWETVTYWHEVAVDSVECRVEFRTLTPRVELRNGECFQTGTDSGNHSSFFLQRK